MVSVSPGVQAHGAHGALGDARGAISDEYQPRVGDFIRNQNRVALDRAERGRELAAIGSEAGLREKESTCAIGLLRVAYASI